MICGNFYKRKQTKVKSCTLGILKAIKTENSTSIQSDGGAPLVRSLLLSKWHADQGSLHTLAQKLLSS